MNTHDFIYKQIDEKLQRENFPPGVCMFVAAEALEYYKRKHTFSKGVFNECMAYARKKAKQISKNKKSA